LIKGPHSAREATSLATPRTLDAAGVATPQALHDGQGDADDGQDDEAARNVKQAHRSFSMHSARQVVVTVKPSTRGFKLNVMAYLRSLVDPSFTKVFWERQIRTETRSLSGSNPDAVVVKTEMSALSVVVLEELARDIPPNHIEFLAQFGTTYDTFAFADEPPAACVLRFLVDLKQRETTVEELYQKLAACALGSIAEQVLDRSLATPRTLDAAGVATAQALHDGQGNADDGQDDETARNAKQALPSKLIEQKSQSEVANNLPLPDDTLKLRVCAMPRKDD
jgi:hypothetical protein